MPLQLLHFFIHLEIPLQKSLHTVITLLLSRHHTCQVVKWAPIMGTGLRTAFFKGPPTLNLTACCSCKMMELTSEITDFKELKFMQR